MKTTQLTEEQMQRAIVANRLKIYSCDAVAAAMAEGLRREMGVPARKDYGRFRLGEGDHASLNAVESPEIKGDL